MARIRSQSKDREMVSAMVSVVAGVTEQVKALPLWIKTTTVFVTTTKMAMRIRQVIKGMGLVNAMALVKDKDRAEEKAGTLLMPIKTGSATLTRSRRNSSTFLLTVSYTHLTLPTKRIV